MFQALDAALALVAFVGHFSLAVWLYNRLHAVALPRSWVKVLEKALLAAAAAVVIAALSRWWITGHALLLSAGQRPRVADAWWLGYAACCGVAAVAVVPCWLIPKLCERVPALLESNDTVRTDIARCLGFAPIAGAETRLLARFPGNELLSLAVQRKTLRLPGLPQALDGLTIAHLSDLHMTGRLTQAFYDFVVDETNALAPDLIVITGDILEKERCLPWIAPTLGRLRAREGKFFILGNHELRLPSVEPLVECLKAAGLVDLGGRAETVILRGFDVMLAGSERPWFYRGKAGFEMPQRAIQDRQSAFSILLAHTPDELPSARASGFDLMLAGHNHGGQIRLPYLGALITPSHFGFRYAGGLYHEPPTLLHVSRGLAGIHPIRLNCPPELPLLILRAE